MTKTHKKPLPQFRLAKKYITNVTKRRKVSLTLKNGETLDGKSLSWEDHPKFTELRERLEREGYIQIERSWWNGDKVLKPFSLNGMPFKVGYKFCCASAISIQLAVYNK